MKTKALGMALLSAAFLPTIASAQVETTPVVTASINGGYSTMEEFYPLLCIATYDNQYQSYGHIDSENLLLCAFDEKLSLIKSFSPVTTPVLMHFFDSNEDACYGYLTQTLFNSDEKYEYLIHQDDKILIISEDGSVIQEISNPTGSWTCDIILTDGNGEYLRLKDAIYNINRGNTSSIVEKVAEIPGMQTSREGDILNVGFEPSSTDRTLNVVSTNGMNVLSRSVAAGESAANIDTRRFVSGVYVVTLQEPGKAAVETTKIIIR